MKTMLELNHTQLKNTCSPSDFSFKTTAELTSLDGIVGQDRALRAFDFGLEVKMKGYNIYMSGPSGTGKTTYARRSTEKKQQQSRFLLIGAMFIIFKILKIPLAFPFLPEQESN